MAAIKFLGASIVSYSATLGWGGQASQLTVTLVEDLINGDLFTPPDVGTPAWFSFEGQKFGGILQNWRRTHSPTGDPLFELTIVDPRDVLNGVQLILNGYSGSTYGMPNIINIYGYLESYGFGTSGSLESGIPWTSVILGLNEMVASGYGGDFGNTITLKGHNYELDLSQLPNIPSYYRIGGDSMTLMEFINDICEAGACDYFFTLDYVNGINFITLHTISRVYQTAQFGKINEFVQSVNAVSKDVGYEFSNVTTGKFVVGGNVIRMWYNQTQSGLSEEYQGVWPYWGLNTYGNAIIGIDMGYDHNVNVDARQVNTFGISDYYPTSIGEMRAALDSQGSWETYLESYNGVAGQHYMKAEKLGIIVSIGNVLDVVNSSGGGNIKIGDLAPMSNSNIAAAGILDDLREENVKRVYEHVRSFAAQYLGKRFMVRIPFLYSKFDDGGNIITSQIPVDAGYIPEEDFYSAYNNGLLPLDFNSLLTEEGKIMAYVRFDNAQLLDFSELDPESLIPSSVNGGVFSMFVKCTVFPEVVYLDKTTGYSPRAVIELPGCVRERSTDFNANIKLVFNGLLGSAADAAYMKTYGQFGSDNFMAGLVGKPIIPNLCNVPLESRVLTYGPWFAVGADGKMEFERDDSLVPWNFGDWNAMDYTGQAKVVSAMAEKQVQEFGQVEFAGTPLINLGDILIAGGPYVTDITVNISEGGITTVYTMNSWSGNYFKILRASVEANAKLSKMNQQMRRNFREAVKNTRSSQYYAARERALVTPRKQSHSSHAMICGELVNKNGVASPNVVIQPYYNTITQLNTNYTGKSAMSLDGLFRPFSTNPDSIEMGHFETPSSGASGPTVYDLNPFQPGADISVCTTDSELPNSLILDKMNTTPSEFRGMALRGPLVITGWGYDLDDKPVPNENVLTGQDWSYNFYPNYNKRSDLWPTGPVDLRWDKENKTWVAKGGVKFETVQMTANHYPGNISPATIYGTDKNISVYDDRGNNFLISGELAKVYFDSSSGYYKFVASNGLIRKVALDEAIAENTAGDATVISDTSTQGSYGVVSVWNTWLDCGDLESGERCYAEYFPYDNVWRLISVSNTAKLRLFGALERIDTGHFGPGTIGDKEITAYDRLGNVFMLPNETAYVVFSRESSSSGEWVFISEHGLTRQVKVQNDINFGSSGGCEINGTSEQIDVFFDIMGSDGDIMLKGVEAVVKYFIETKRWSFIASSCGVPNTPPAL